MYREYNIQYFSLEFQYFSRVFIIPFQKMNSSSGEANAPLFILYSGCCVLPRALYTYTTVQTHN